MKIYLVILILSTTIFCLSFGLRQKKVYKNLYAATLDDFKQRQVQLRKVISKANVSEESMAERFGGNSDALS